MTKLDLPKNYSNPNKRNLRSNSKKINFENDSICAVGHSIMTIETDDNEGS